ncbi:MAG: hypothetical protein WCD76_08090 [Pyrinomonadaceae bacterium]
MKTLSCPQCGASLQAGPIIGPTVECPYCHSTVIVPAELRPPVSSFVPPVADNSKAKLYIVAVVCGVVLLPLIVLILTRDKQRRVEVPPYQTPRFAMTPSPRATATPASDVLLTFGGEGTGNGLFKDAAEVAVDDRGNIYVTDDTLRIQKFDREGKFLSVWMLPSESKWYTKFRGGPDKILSDRAGHLLVLASGVVLKLDGETGEVLGAAHGTDYIHDAALAADGGLLLVSEKGEGDDELVRLDARGMPVRRVHRFMSSILEKSLQVRVVRVASDGVGNIFAVYALGDASGEFWYDAEDLAVLRLTPEGKYVNRFGSSGHDAGQYETPNCIATDNQSRVYICDSHNGIHLFAPDGRYLENIKTPFWVNGLALDHENNMYVVGSNKVAKLAARK